MHQTNDQLDVYDGQILNELVNITPARIGVGRAGTSPLTSTLLRLRLDHTAAVNAVYSEVDPQLVAELGLLPIQTECVSKEIYLRRPDQGRRLSEASEVLLRTQCSTNPQVQDGLSAAAVEANIRDILPSLLDSLKSHGLASGTPLFFEEWSSGLHESHRRHSASRGCRNADRRTTGYSLCPLA